MRWHVSREHQEQGFWDRFHVERVNPRQANGSGGGTWDMYGSNAYANEASSSEQPLLESYQVLRPLLKLPKSARKSIFLGSASAQSDRRQTYLARKAMQKLQAQSHRNLRNSRLHLKGINSRHMRPGRGKQHEVMKWEYGLGSHYEYYDDYEDADRFYEDHADYNAHFEHHGEGWHGGWSADFSAYTKKTFGECPVCMEAQELLQFDCSHSFCFPCLLQQLAARWSGPRISFTYLQCCLCRQPMKHQEIQVPLQIHDVFKRNVEQLALVKFRGEGLCHEWQSKLSYQPSHQEVVAEALQRMAMFMCARCNVPFCGGLVSCAEQQSLPPEDMCCSDCEWRATSGLEDHRCNVHGHDFAIYKCDFCCDVALYRCFGTTNFCERCHLQASSNIYYPCNGDACSLCMSHPCITSETGDGAVRSFVLGCTACQGLCEANQMGLVNAGAAGAFGYPQRNWNAFTGGDILLAALGEREVRHRLRHVHISSLEGGTAVECAERLLLLELDLSHPEAVLAHLGKNNLSVLRRRLGAVGLRTDGNSFECAGRLLMLRNTLVEALRDEHMDCVEMPPLEYVDDSYSDLSPLAPVARTSETAHCMLLVKMLVLLAIVGLTWGHHRWHWLSCYF